MQTSRTAESTANIESIYPLSPMQEGMLFHTLLKPDSGIYLMQNRYMLQGDLDSGAFVRAWQRVVERHSILRTSFVWKTQKQPLQVVHKHIDLPMEVLDWRTVPVDEQAGRLNGILHAELQAGFDFGKAPLMRFRLIRLTEDTYEFVHSFHHILLDEWCTSLLMMDFLAHYEAFAQGKALQRDAPRPYRDYIGWLQKQDLPSTESFWRHYLKGFASPTPVAFDQLPDGLTDQNADAGGDTTSLSADATRRLVALARQHQLTLNTVVQAAWALLLSHYSGERDVLFGVTVAGRPPELPGVEATVGLFINTLPLRVRVEPERPLVPWLTDLLDDNIRLRQYEYAPLVQVQGWGEVPRGQTLFHSLLVFENAPIHPALRDGKIVFKVRDVQYRVHTNYPLTVVAWQGTELGLKLSYDRRLFHAETIARMLEHLKRVLSAMADRPDARLGELPVLTDAERQQVVVLWNETGSGRSEQQSFAPLFEEQVRRTPDAPAVVCNDRQLSYADLNERANRVARALMAEGVEAETVVALLDERGIDLLTMMLGVFKAGGAYLPLDPQHPIQRLAQVVDLSRSPVILTAEGRVPHLVQALELIAPERRPRILVIEQVLAQPWPAGNPEARCTRDHLAYVIYTSGSTGVPKGAMVEHKGMLNNFLSKLSGLGLTGADVIAQTASQCFDISVWQFMAALLCGGRVHIVPDHVAHDPQRLLLYMDEQAVTIVETVPALMQGMLDAEAVLGVLPALARLRWLLPTGEALPAALCRRWLQQYPAVPLLNAYGPAECSDDVAVHAIRPPFPDDLVHVPIGRPIDNIRLYILNAFLAPVPVGVPGELCVAGVGVGRGYVNDPARTAAVFVPDPFNSEAGGRLYKTGDLARYQPDGTIEFLGRRDHQVKVRGYRIELGEIEAQLRYHPDVHDAVVLAREDRPGEKRLVAYVVGHKGRVPETEGLRGFLREKLPEYMVPSALLILDTLPRTPNGKTDRHALPAPDASGQTGHQYVGPRTATEDIITGIWAEVLGLERIGVHDHFFDLGGHSLLATQVISRLRGAFQLELPLRTLFDAPTVAGLAAAVEKARMTVPEPDELPLAPANQEGAPPLSFAQQRLWFLSQLEPTAASYNVPAAVRLIGSLDRQALEESFMGVLRRHDVLRTTFVVIGGQPVQQVASDSALQMPVVDLGTVPEAERQMIVRRLAAEEAQRPFDLTRGPLFRVRLLAVHPSEHVLLLTLHHSVSDGWSMNVLIRELTELYGASMAGQPSTLAPLPLQYADYAVWQRRWLQGAVRDRQLDYWLRDLGGAVPALHLPTDRLRPAVQSYRGARYTFTVPADLCGRLLKLSRRQGVTLFMTLLAGFQVLLFRYTGQTDLCIGTPIANRTRVELEGLIGLFVNTLVLRTNVAGNPRFTDLLARVREKVLAAHAHQDLPFEQLVEALHPARDLSRSPLFQVMFALQTPSAMTTRAEGLQIGVLEVDPGTAQFDLSLDMILDDEGLSGSFEYSTDLFEEATIRRMAEHLLVLLEGMAVHPETRLADLPLLTELERQQSVVAWNPAPVGMPAEGGIHALFEAQAARNPEAVALVWEGRSLTYRSLNARSNQLAHALRRQGVGPDVRVGLCVDRSFDMIVGLLGILKAGGAYVPIDPAYPPDRIAYLLADAQAPVLLTQESLLHGLPAGAMQRVLCLDRDWAEVAPESEANPAIVTTPLNLAYLIYTSGSTGRPKGAMVSHGSLMRTFEAWQHAYQLTEDLCLLQMANLAFDVFTADWIRALCSGGKLVLCPTEILLAPEALHALMRQEQVNGADFVPAVVRPLIRSLEQTGQRLDGMRLLIVGSDVWEQREYDALRRLCGPATRIVNAYGVTEATIDSAYFEGAPHAAIAPTQAVPIGRPLSHTQLYICDTALQPVPVGIPGELYIGGAGLARGYWQRPDLTAERFLPDPLSPIPGARLYRTGDRARRLSDGTVEFLGRLDEQVKLRGVRIELGEIEARLAMHPDVREVVVLLREDQPGEKRLTAYVVPQTGAALSTGGLRQWLLARVPEVMVPTAILLMDALPVTPHGKVDRRALPVPERSHSEAPQVSPRSDHEAQLAAIWAQVLGLEEVGIHDNFFELGGDSILSLQVIARAREAGLSLTPRQLFQHQTIAALAADIETDTGGAKPPDMPVPEQGLVTGTVPLTPIQQWFFDQAWPNVHHWNQSLLLSARQPLEMGPLESAVSALQRHHDALRLRFMPDGQGWLQVHAPDGEEAPVHRVDLSRMPDAEQQAALEQAATEWQGTLHLTDGPLLRVVWFDCGGRQPGRLLLVIHHLVIDGVSWRIVLEDLQTAYEQAAQGLPIRLPAKSSAFKQWAERLQGYAQHEALQSEAASWLAVGRKEPPLPVDNPAGERTEAHQATVTAALSESETRALLQNVHEAYGTQVDEVLLTALVQTVATWARSESVLIELEGHGRQALFDDVDVSRTVGWFTNVYPVRLAVPGDGAPGSALKATKERLRRLPNRGIGYGLLRYGGPAPVADGLAAAPPAQIGFNYLGQWDQAFSDAGLFTVAKESPGLEHDPHSPLPYELDINAAVFGGRLEITWTYSQARYRRATVETLSERHLEGVRGLIAHCLSPEAGGYTPSDFPDIDIEQHLLDTILEQMD